MNTNSKRIQYQTLQTYWLSRSSHTLYYYCLDQLACLVTTIFKGQITLNLNEELEQEIEKKLSENHFKLYKKLVHGFTLLNHNYRIYTEQGYLVTKEDMINALALFQLKINPDSVLTGRSKWIYEEIKHHFLDQEFTLKQVYTDLGLKQATAKHHLVALRNLQYIEHTRTGVRNEFYYRAVK